MTDGGGFVTAAARGQGLGAAPLVLRREDKDPDRSEDQNTAVP